MKLENQTAKIATICGTCRDNVTLPDGRQGNIEYSFEFNPENDNMIIFAGTLTLSKGKVVSFEKHSNLWKSALGGVLPDDWDISDILYNHFALLKERLKNARVSVSFPESALD